MDVSVLVITYNHKAYINKAIDSILMQKGNLEIEILICDDGSTDGTDFILKKYKEKYPTKIKLYLRKINMAYPTRNIYELLKRAKGRYIAFLEGDDYWIDEYKLEKQVAYLDNNLDCGGYISNTITVDSNEKMDDRIFYQYIKHDKKYTWENYARLEMPGMLGVFMMRNPIDIIEDVSILYMADKMMGDITIYMLSLYMGKIFQSTEVLGAYRYVCNESADNFNSITINNKYKNYNILRFWLKLEKYIKTHKCEISEIKNIKEAIIEYKSDYSIYSMIRLLGSRDNKKYLLFYLLSLNVNYYKEEYMCPKLVQMKTWREYMKDQSHIILFGTGKIAEKYINDFGWDKNIEFCVDNDKTKQGKRFRGYKIESPEMIKKCKDESKVLVVSEKYEKEIEQQLIKMGVENYYFYCAMQSSKLVAMMIKKLCRKGN